MAAFGPHIDDPVGVANDVEVVLDDNDGVASIDQAVHNGEHTPDVREMQTGGGLVQDVDAAPFVEIAGKFDALALTA